MPVRRASKGRPGANALDTLVNYPWPGNVRELEHLVQRLMIFTGGYTIQVHDLPWTVKTDPSAPTRPTRRRRAVAQSDTGTPDLL